ncbi:MAG TPA: aminotransferase class I/II-fold pyridoxal phosphate-dependent enzyme [Firmicutes bacterium]|nr:aminotransferase class I/II-fold pyridoxal phosphate-dependent enzyme [Bacillota bacterium]
MELKGKRIPVSGKGSRKTNGRKTNRNIYRRNNGKREDAGEHALGREFMGEFINDRDSVKGGRYINGDSQIRKIADGEAGGHGGNVYAAAAAHGLRPEDFCDFSSNINPLGPPPGLLSELKKHLEQEICRYPAPQAAPFRAALARDLGIPEERLLIGNGANELIHLFFLWKRPKKVLIPAPTFSEYARAARLAGAKVEYFRLLPEKAFSKEKLVAQVQMSGSDLIVFCNPNNPTGMYYPRELLEEIALAVAEKGVAVFIDESFFPFTGRSASESFSGSVFRSASGPGSAVSCPVPGAPCSGHSAEPENAGSSCGDLWAVASLTKLWALPGLRLGYLLGPPEGIRSLTENGDPWRVNALAQRAGNYCLFQKQHIRDSLELVKGEREFLLRELEKIDGLKVYPGEANYLLLRGLSGGFSSADLCRKLASRGILIRDASNFPALDRSYFRIAVRPRRENLRLLSALRDYVCGVM